MKHHLRKLRLEKKTIMRLDDTGARNLHAGATTACITARDCPPPPVTYTCFTFFCP